MQFTYLASWCFEPRHPKRILSGLKRIFSLSRAKNNLQSISQLFNPRVIKLQVSCFKFFISFCWLVGALSPVTHHNSLSKHFTKKLIHHNTLYTSQNTPISLGKSKLYSQFRNANPDTQLHVFEPIYIPRALNTGSCINCL